MASQSGYHDAGSSARPKLGPRDLPSKRLLGTGVASVVYETELNGRKYARKDFMGVPSGTFRREAARLVALEGHINVVKTLDWIENNMSCSLVLEYIDEDLLGFLQKRKQSQVGSTEAAPSPRNRSDLDSRNTIKHAPFELPEALDVMLQIARGMEFLADRRIRHGNLKTKNVLVSRDGNSLSVKVADFGLVQTRRKSTSFASRQARKLDMARWTAPENLEVYLLEDKGETSSDSDEDEDGTVPSDVPEWRELGADVYSFAVICSQILTGEDPYPNLNWKKLGVSIVRHRRLPTLPAACPPELKELLVSCWGFDRRYFYLDRPSFSHIRTTLERVRQMGFPAQESRPPLLLKSPTDIMESAPMNFKKLAQRDIKKLAQRDIKREDQLREPIPGEQPTDAVRGIGLREPITVEDLWGPRCDEHVIRVPLDPSAGTWSFWIYQEAVVGIARVIARARRVVRRRTEWTQVREELELVLPDLLRIRNRWYGYLRTAAELKGSEEWGSLGLVPTWSMQLRSAVGDMYLEVLKDDQPLLSSLSAAFTALREPWRLSKLRNNFTQVAKLRKEMMLYLTEELRRAQGRVKVDLARSAGESKDWIQQGLDRQSYDYYPLIRPR